ncbi:MAG: VOC family protein [Nannocystaceae bacterium]|jgi:catechol 2,3-dioxygenase-like lactoylglutathione lyase family enzyme
MATLRPTIKLIAPSNRREALQTMFCDVFGARLRPVAPHLDVYELDGGGSIGVELVPEWQALTATQQREAGTWLEFGVADPAAAIATLDRLGLQRVAYHDQAHTYFAAPSGHVFRIAQA